MSRATDPAPTTSDELDRRLSAPDDAAIAAVQHCPGSFAVLGAGGKMGLHVCQMLRRALQALGRQDPVFAISRFASPQATVPFVRSGIEVIAADLSAPSVYAQLPSAANVVFLAGVNFGTASSPELLQRMNVSIPGILEVLRRQGLAPSNRCLDPAETLSPDQAEELDRVTCQYPWLVDDAFVAAHLQQWLGT